MGGMCGGAFVCGRRPYGVRVCDNADACGGAVIVCVQWCAEWCPMDMGWRRPVSVCRVVRCGG